MGESEIQELLGDILKSTTQDIPLGIDPQVLERAILVSTKILTSTYSDGTPIYEGNPPEKFVHSWEKKLWEEHLGMRGISLEPPEEPPPPVVEPTEEGEGE